MRVLISLGRNALVRRGEAADVATQRGNAVVAASAIAEIAREHDVIVTHGNGPQIDALALQNAGCTGVSPSPLDVLGAESEGMMGYLLELALRNALPTAEILSVLTQVLVDADDPALERPTKPVGRAYTFDEAERLAGRHGWTFGPDAAGLRRLVRSPEPRAVLEAEALRRLVDAGVIPICAGGGGVPLAADGAGTLVGVEAVVDKDLTAGLMARSLDADLLVMLTDVDAVCTDWGAPTERPIREATVDTLRAQRFDSRSIGPKVDAACRFVDTTGNPAAIGALSDAAAVVRGMAGTRIVAEPEPAPALGAAVAQV